MPFGDKVTRFSGFLPTSVSYLRVALHEVSIVTALGHVEANAKSFGKKTIFKIRISIRFQMKKIKLNKFCKLEK